MSFTANGFAADFIPGLGMGYDVLLQVDRGLRKQSSGHRRTRGEGDVAGRHEHSHKLTARSDGRVAASDRPEDVRGLGAVFEVDGHAGGRAEGAGDLEDPAGARAPCALR